MDSSLPPECEQLLISGYVLGNLSPAEAALFEELMANNPEIAKQVMEFQQVLELAYSPKEVSPPPALRAKILDAMIQSETSASTSQTEESSTVGFRLSWRKILAAIATTLILTLGFNNYRLWNKLQIAQTQNPISTPLVFSLQANNKPATAKLIADPERLEAMLTVDNLPPLPPEQVYVLWTVVGKEAPFTTDEKGAILTEVFQVNEKGAFSQKIILPKVFRNSEQIKKLAITIEDKSAPQDHSGSILIATEIEKHSYYRKLP